MKLNIITLLFFSFCIGQNTELFDKGNDLYNQGRYLEAIESYSDIIKDGKHSSELYYNMGNSYYKLNDIANSIFYYEKALLLNPKSDKITNNLFLIFISPSIILDCFNLSLMKLVLTLFNLILDKKATQL